MPRAGFSLDIGGTARIYCVHNRPKRIVRDLAFDLTKNKVQLCPCCENLFLTHDDTPRYCADCGGEPVFPLGGPLPTPQGVIHG